VLVLSLFQRGEIEEVLNRPKIAQVYSLTLEERTRLLRRLDAESEFVEPQLTISVPLRDPKDALILGMALAGHVDYLVTGDKDLHALVGDPSLGKLKIVTVADFLPLLREHESNESDDDEDPGSPSAPPIPT
jgi:putative PIN family toxin of toxin-antitoxin system